MAHHLVSAGLLVALRILKGSGANIRYGVSAAALVIAFILPLVTFIQISTDSRIDTVTDSIDAKTTGREVAPGPLGINQQVFDAAAPEGRDYAQNITSFAA
jgi:hypothetical protein